MKKLIAILLVVLVAGLVFGADMSYPNDAKLTLESTVYQKVNHGFHGGSSAIDNFSDIISFTTIDNTVSGLDMEDGNLQAAGFYSFASNSKVGVVVNIATQPLKLDGEEIYVPYNLEFEKVFGTITLGQGDGIYNMLTNGTGGFSEDEEQYGVSGNLIELTGPDSLRWGSFAVRVKFDGATNKTAGLPQGDYTGTVTASISAE